MKRQIQTVKPVGFLLSIIFLLNSSYLIAQEVFTFKDVMQFEAIERPVLSANGEWVAFGVWPERGDGEARIKHADGEQIFTIERGDRPQLSADGRWAAAIVKPPFVEAENAGRDRPKQGFVLLNTDSGEQESMDRVQRFEFSNDGQWLLVWHDQSEEVEDAKPENSHIGRPVSLVHLETNTSREIPFVNEASIDSTSHYFVYATVDTSGEENALYGMELNERDSEARRLLAAPNTLYSNLTWDHQRSRLAFTVAEIDTAGDYRLNDASIFMWEAFDGEPSVLIEAGQIEDGYRLRSRNRLQWTYDGQRLFYGVQDAAMVALDERTTEEDSLTTENIYDLDRILEGIEGKVWHWDDPLIKTHEKQTWNSRKNHLYTAVYHLDVGRSVQLAGKELPYVSMSNNTGWLLGSSDLPYLKLITWDGRYRDYFLVDIETGDRSQFLEKQRSGAVLSPNGFYAAWFDGADWNIMSTSTGEFTNLTETLDVPFADEDNDRPQLSNGYGIAGWTDGDEAVIIYDKYDIWQFDTQTGEYLSITGGKGRDEKRIFRIRDLESNRHTFEPDERLLLTMYHDWEKNYGFYESRIGRSGVSRLMEDDEKYGFVAKAEESDILLYTVERYDVYPNLWISDDRRFRNTRQLTHLYEDMKERWNWGYAERIDWLNMDGKEVQGVVIYPDDYDPGRRYPVFIYYYERYSQRLHDFNHPVTNHRPNIAQYVSDGYVFFLPDVWFTIGQPGYSATKNIVPGVQKLVEMGVADPQAVGIHGHSWSGYQTAQIVTETDIFAAAIAGAPVGNMTSAYSGIRWGSGLARQFQYEKTQSRLGVSMWENLAPYIENSPVFFADRINTPLLIQHGDADEAVPWYQSIELYLALRRNGKESVFLHYYDEPHHLRKLANRLDYAIKMKEYFDHYLKGEPAPSWITDGVPYGNTE